MRTVSIRYLRPSKVFFTRSFRRADEIDEEEEHVDVSGFSGDGGMYSCSNCGASVSRGFPQVTENGISLFCSVLCAIRSNTVVGEDDDG